MATMQLLPRLASLLFVLVSLPATVSSQECGLYLAESSSSTEDEPKLGLFAGIDISPQTLVSPMEVAVHTHNLIGHSLDAESVYEEDYEKFPLRTKAVELFEQWVWVAEASGGAFELPPDQKTLSAISGAGMLGGYHPRLINSEWNHTSAYLRPILGETPGKPHPGRGAYSPFYNVALVSSTKIPAGHEIFMDYGDNWDEVNSSPDQLSEKEHEKIDQVVESMVEFMDKHKDELTPQSKQEIYNFLVHDVITAAAGEAKGKLVADILPENPDDLYKVMDAGGSLLYRNPTVMKPVEWLEEHGLCMDSIESRPSTIPNAGRGAFARRAIKKGGRISPVPMAHIADKSVMNMYELERTDDGEYYRANDNVIGQQLLLNYCYGHPESSLLLFPAGSVVNFINHHSKKANAELVWSNHSWNQDDLFDVPPQDLVYYHSIGLMMEIVATKDIKPNEEIFLNYGKSWQAAWDENVKEWKKSKLAEWPIRAVDMNEQYRNSPHKTEDERELDPIDDRIIVKCFLVVTTPEDPSAGAKFPDHTIKKWITPKKGSAYEARHMFDCSILDRQEFKEDSKIMYNYTVSYTVQQQPHAVLDVPHDAIVFVDAPTMGDHFTFGPFRHYIEIPDNVFPKGVWRDLK